MRSALRFALPFGVRSAFASGVLTVLLLTGAPALHAQVTGGEVAARRDSLAARMGDGALVAFGGRSPVGHDGRFFQLPAFRYLSDFLEPDAALVLVSANGRAETVLFTDPPPVRRQLYDGLREAPADVAARLGVRVRPLAGMVAFVDSLAQRGTPLWELRDFLSADYASRDSLTRGGAFVAALEARHPGVEVQDAHPLVDALRVWKSDAELASLRRAIDITGEAHRAALRTVRPGAYEYEAEATIESTFRRLGAQRPSFSSIVGSGPNATTLHYAANSRRMEAGDVVVMDIGAEVDGYAADVTRTVPVSGRWTPEQRAIYDLVLEAQQAAEQEVRVGAPALSSVIASVEVRLRGLAALGLVESEEALMDPPWPADCERAPQFCRQGQLWMIHGISHGIGLEVHDPAGFYDDAGVYVEGDVFTIEPGIYVSLRALSILPDTPRNRQFAAAVREAVARYDNVGVRIEDDYRVTSGGLERLSAGAPRDPEEIERLMQEGPQP
ncbi:MAG TPA: aminopeptidase P N-terminal domain-containing protein [Rhodothermales bacterium]|nr:aminopeptidase P N-terminal domain-containing protein [Rhodothermales bacterium]